MSTHRTSLARALQAETGWPYQRCLGLVLKAAGRGQLPAVWTPESEASALRVLATATQNFPVGQEPTSASTPEQLHDAVRSAWLARRDELKAEISAIGGPRAVVLRRGPWPQGAGRVSVTLDEASRRLEVHQDFGWHFLMQVEAFRRDEFSSAAEAADIIRECARLTAEMMGKVIERSEAVKRHPEWAAGLTEECDRAHAWTLAVLDTGSAASLAQPPYRWNLPQAVAEQTWQALLERWPDTSRFPGFPNIPDLVEIEGPAALQTALAGRTSRLLILHPLRFEDCWEIDLELLTGEKWSRGGTYFTSPPFDWALQDMEELGYRGMI